MAYLERASRQEIAYRIRVAAAQLARDRPHEKSFSNGEEGRYRHPKTGEPSYTANFTKGLAHLSNGQLADHRDYIDFVRAIDSGSEADIRRIPLGPENTKDGKPIWRSRMARDADVPVRAWESMGAGHVYSLEGPDAQSVAMPPAPRFDSCEMVAEMAELYLMATLRDVPFICWEQHPGIQAAIESLNGMKWFSRRDSCYLTDDERGRKRNTVRLGNLFRGRVPGARRGPYLSQYLIVGSNQLGGPNKNDKLEGRVRFGAYSTVQKVRIAEPHVDFLTDWNSFLDSQDGADFRGMESYAEGERFIATPRDLCTYVHYDALYQAYLTACLIMLADRVPFDPGLPFQEKDSADKQQGFAHFGGPHILSLVTEVATRALKAVRYQKFNVHRRCRPEWVAGLIHRNVRSVSTGKKEYPEVNRLADDLAPILAQVEAHNHEQNEKHGRNGSSGSGKKNGGCCKSHSNSGCGNPGKSSYLLPMAFPEGSPMHPSYGAGHATVAAACVTILKAFFDSNHEIAEVYVPAQDGSHLVQLTDHPKLTVGGELNKLAANISIGRNWAGVHYYSDYIESFRLGEKIAIGILEEQKLLFGENFYMSVEKMDGSVQRI